MTRPDSVHMVNKDLTARQEQALMLVITGLSYKKAAEKMGIIKGAFQHLMQRAMRQMNCTNLAQLTYKYYAEEFQGPIKVRQDEQKGKCDKENPETLHLLTWDRKNN